MTIIEQLDDIIDNQEDFYVSFDGVEIGEIDFKDQEILMVDGEAIPFSEVIESPDFFSVYSLTRMDFPEDIFELASLLKKMKKEIEGPKEKVVLFINGNQVCTADGLEEVTTIDYLEDYLSNFEFFHKSVKKNFVKA